MCVIFLAFEQRLDYPLILLDNRDEFYARPTDPAAYWKDFPQIFAGRDLVRGGSWLGATDRGRFAVVSNYRGPRSPGITMSRGNLVVDFLKTNEPAEKYLQKVRANAQCFSGFNLLVGEINAGKKELFYFSNRGEEVKELKPGIYGLSNHLLDTPWRKVVYGKCVFTGLLKNNDLPREEFFELLSDETLAADEELPSTGIPYEVEKALSAIFIKTPDYGTRCSTVLTIDKNFEFDLEERVFV